MDQLVSEIKKSMSVIGRNQYQAFKRYNFKTISTEDAINFREIHKISVSEAEKQIKLYEEKHSLSQSSLKKQVEYFSKVRNPKPDQEKVLIKEDFYNFFRLNFWKMQKVNFITNEVTVENIKPLFYYFLGDLENFRKCKNVSHLSIPSLEKGLLIIGGYGNGKSSTMKAIEESLKTYKSKTFKGYTTNEAVKMYEACETPTEKKVFDKNMLSGNRYFDDVLTERLASNYGKSNIFKDILEERYIKKKLTHISCNYDESYPGDLEKGIEQFGLKYGSRIYDRIFQMFNIVEFKGNSFRK